MNHDIAILPHTAHKSAVEDAKKALIDGDFEGLGINREALRDAQYDSLVDRFLHQANLGFDPIIPEVSLQVYHDAYDATWMRATNTNSRPASERSRILGSSLPKREKLAALAKLTA